MKSLRDYLDLLESAGLTDTDVLTDTIQRYRENIAMMPKEEYKGKFEEYILDIDTQHLDGERIIYQFENSSNCHSSKSDMGEAISNKRKTFQY